MKVICIKGVSIGSVGVYGNILRTVEEPWMVTNKSDELVEGNIYTVEEILPFPDTEYYKLVENNQTVYRCDRFAPLSEIDETEMERNYQTKTATI